MTSERLVQVEPEGEGPLWQIDSVANKTARFRGKENTKLTDARAVAPGLFSKSVTQQEGLADTTGLLHRELRFLERLRGSGVTPQAFALKESSDGKQAHLLIEQLSGRSYEARGKPDKAEHEQMEAVIAASLESLDQVHRRGVYIADINAGTFLVEGLGESDRTPQVKIVDFELAVDEERIPERGMQKHLKHWYAMRGDIGTAIACQDRDFQITPTLARAAERYLTILKALDFFLGDDWQQFSRSRLSERERSADTQAALDLSPALNLVAREKLSEQYAYYHKSSKPDQIPETKDQFVSSRLDAKVRHLARQATAYLSLPKLLEEKNIPISAEGLNHLQLSLQPYPARRPRQAFFPRTAFQPAA